VQRGGHILGETVRVSRGKRLRKRFSQLGEAAMNEGTRRLRIQTGWNVCITIRIY
jgi:hypothetical protein